MFTTMSYKCIECLSLNLFMSDFDFTFYANCTEKYKKNQEGPIKKCTFNSIILEKYAQTCVFIT